MSNAEEPKSHEVEQFLANFLAEANQGKMDLAQSESFYHESRRSGMRDKATREFLGPQPLFFDSGTKTEGQKQPRNQKSAGKNRQTAYKGAVQAHPAAESRPVQQTEAAHVASARGVAEQKAQPVAAVNGVPDQEKASEERLVKYDYPDGSSVSVKYIDAELHEIKIESGSWIKSAQSWIFYDLQARKRDELIGQMQVTEKGDIIAARHDGYTEIQYADGTFQMKHADGRSETHYADGWSVIQEACGKRVYCKHGKQVELGAKKNDESPDLNTVCADRRIAELNGWNAQAQDWKPVQKEAMQKKSGIWYKNDRGDSLKQDAKTGTTTVFHDDGSWEQLDKNGKLKIHLVA